MSRSVTASWSLRTSFFSSPKRPLSAAVAPLCVSSQSQWQSRKSSHSPLGHPLASARKKVTINTLRALHLKGEPITMITAHDFPSAHVADHAGMDIVLVGDSLAMVALGMEDTSEVVLEEMILHCRSVSRATKAAFTVCSASRPHVYGPDKSNVLHRLEIFPWVHTR